MKKPKQPEINLPYASTVASFFGDQGAAQGNSFLGRLYKGGGRSIIMNNAAANAAGPTSIFSGRTPAQSEAERK